MPDLTHEQYAEKSAELLREQMTAGNSSPELVIVAGHLAYSLSMHAEMTHDEEHAEPAACWAPSVTNRRARSVRCRWP
jgi:hypothetical protein